MNKKSILGLLSFGGLVIAGLIYAAIVITGSGIGAEANQGQQEYTNEDDNAIEEPWLYTNPSDMGERDEYVNIENADGKEGDSFSDTEKQEEVEVAEDVIDSIGDAINGAEDLVDSTGDTINGAEDLVDSTGDTINGTEDLKDSTDADIGTDADDIEDTQIKEAFDNNRDTGAVGAINTQHKFAPEVSVCELIIDCNTIDYETYIPEMIYDGSIEVALDIVNPSIKLNAESAILFDADTKEVIYYKNPVIAEYPASTVKLLTSLVALDWCYLDEEINIGNEIKMIAKDSTKAGLYDGEIVTTRILLEGMLLPSGNDAAYAMAAYVGRKSLQSEGANRMEAVTEFVRLMNVKAKQLGAINSNFKTPDGYDAVGQYTTAYDMGMIGLAAVKNETILEISNKAKTSNVFISGEDITWKNTNALVKKDSGLYYSDCIGLKTGTSTMAGRCLVAAGRRNGKEVVCVILDSTSQGRWQDAITLLNYGLGK